MSIQNQEPDANPDGNANYQVAYLNCDVSKQEAPDLTNM